MQGEKKRRRKMPEQTDEQKEETSHGPSLDSASRGPTASLLAALTGNDDEVWKHPHFFNKNSAQSTNFDFNSIYTFTLIAASKVASHG